MVLVVSVMVTEELNKKSREFKISLVTLGGVAIITNESSYSALFRLSRDSSDPWID